MPNLIVNPGFDALPPDQNPDPWVLTDSYVSDWSHAQPRSAPQFVRLLASRLVGIPVVGGNASQDVAVDEGAVHSWGFWFDSTDSGATDLKVDVIQGGVPFSSVTLSGAAYPPGWRQFVGTPFVTTDPTLTISVTALPRKPPPTSGEWRVDDFTLFNLDTPAMARSRWTAYSNIVALFQGINGGSVYHTDLGGRVYMRFIDPRRQDAVFPYVCVPLAQDAPQIEDMQNMVKITWTMNVYGFVPETSSQESGSDAVQRALYLNEDLIHVILNNRTLNGAVQAVELLPGGESIAGVDQEMWGETRVPLAVTLYADANDFKP